MLTREIQPKHLPHTTFGSAHNKEDTTTLMQIRSPPMVGVFPLKDGGPLIHRPLAYREMLVLLQVFLEN